VLRIVLVKAMGQAPTQAIAADFTEAGGVIGRASSCTLHLPDPYQHISREQARIVFDNEQYSVVACGIPNIVLLNGRELIKDVPAPVQNGDELIIGEFELSIEAAAPRAAPTPEPISESPTMFWNSLGSDPKSTSPDPFANLFASTPASSGPSNPLPNTGVRPAAPGSSTIPDDFDIWGDLSSSQSKPPDLPLADPARSADRSPAERSLFEQPTKTGVGRTASMPSSKAQDALGLGNFGSSAQAESIDDLFGLKGSGGAGSSDPLGVAGTRQQSFSGDPQALGHLEAFLNTPKAYTEAPLSDHTPEIHGTFSLPQARSPEKPLPEKAQPEKAGAAKAAENAAPEKLIPTQILAPEAIKEIAAQVASEHPFAFEDTPKTQATDLLEGLNRQSVKAQLKQKLAQSPKPAALPASGQDASGQDASGQDATGQDATGHDKLLAAFLVGLQLTKLPKTALSLGQPDAGLTPALMERVGELLRISTQGTQELLTARSLLKREMKTEVTMIVSKDNNPLKFSPDTESALAHLLSPIPIRGFLSPAESVQDAFDDLGAHQMAFVAGMRAAIQSLVNKFDPAHLESRLTKKSMIESMVPATRKAKLWERFSELYTEISREAEDDFEAFFGKEFVKAYEAQISHLDQKNKRS
jgi:FHA domain-containing protein